MTPIFKKIFNSPVLYELNRLTRDNQIWEELKGIDLTTAEWDELIGIFNDPEYIQRNRFDINTNTLSFKKVTITIEGQNGIDYINARHDEQNPRGWFPESTNQVPTKPWYKRIL